MSAKPSKALVAGFWVVTALLALQMGFTAYAQLRLPQVAAAFMHLGFPSYFRIELACIKVAGVGLRGIRHHTRVGADRAPECGRWSAGMGLGSGDSGAVGVLVLSMEANPKRLGTSLARPPQRTIGKAVDFEFDSR